MCGIAGCLTGRHDVGALPLDGALDAMQHALAHRGPDAHAIWSDASAGIGLAHRRLAVIDLSPLGAQPMHSRSGRWAIAFNGEIYNHRALRADLAADGCTFRGHGDTETLIEALDAWGVDRTLARTNGMFAFAAWDRDERRLVLARDRLGEKPLYWTVVDGALWFASELKAFRALGGFRPEIDPAAVAALLRWGFVPHPGTIYQGVQQLAPGHLLEARLDAGEVRVVERTWWNLGDVVSEALAARPTGPVDMAAASEELRALLADAVATRMESDVPLGSFLSGGIDSSLVAALAQQALGGSGLRTFTVRMPEIGFDESVHAESVARHLGTVHTTVDMPVAEVLAAVPQLAGVWDEPFADPSMLPSLMLCRAARQHLTVCLAGDGGDEIFAGYNRHSLGNSLWRRVRPLPASARGMVARAMLRPSPASVDGAVAAIGRVLPPRLRIPNGGDKVQKAAAVLQADETGLWASLAQIWPADAVPLEAVARRTAVPHGPTIAGLDPVEELVLTDTAVVLPDQMLAKVDRASMAAALEVRAPLLDHRLLEWSWRQPLAVKTAGGVGKIVLRDVLAGMVPPAITDRPKMGFDPPLAAWLRGPLREWAGDLLTSSHAVEHGWLSGDALRRTWADHLAGTRNFDYRLWSVLMLESWLRDESARAEVADQTQRR
jgi:asparagine synthase (glutamine-hydrolysing)